jgi:hypothetical protein
MRVEVSGKQFVFPRQCACCGRFPGNRLTISGTERNRNSRTKGWAWDVPYCRHCLTHVKLTDQILVGALSLVALTGIGAFGGFALGVDWLVCLVGFLVVSAMTSVTVWLHFKGLKRGRFAGCAALTRSVRYLGSSGSWHAFDFQSRTYITAFVRANRLKLVNASATISSMLRGMELSEFQVARRITRRPK